jgi:hypothetical protein
LTQRALTAQSIVAQPDDYARNKLNTTQATQLKVVAGLNTNDHTTCPATKSKSAERAFKNTRRDYTRYLLLFGSL